MNIRTPDTNKTIDFYKDLKKYGFERDIPFRMKKVEHLLFDNGFTFAKDLYSTLFKSISTLYIEDIEQHYQFTKEQYLDLLTKEYTYFLNSSSEYIEKELVKHNNFLSQYIEFISQRPIKENIEEFFKQNKQKNRNFKYLEQDIIKLTDLLHIKNPIYIF